MTLTHTLAISAFGNGGGIYNSGTLLLNNSTISGKAAFGGGIYNFRGTVNLSNSTISLIVVDF